jgi:small-conductance mechanosensitive channel
MGTITTTHDEWTKLLAPFAALLDVASIEAMVARILGAGIILLVGFWTSRALQQALVRRLLGIDTGAPEATESYKQFVRFFVMGIAVLLAVHTLGIDLTHVFTAGGLLAVATAFATKNLSENLIAGWILRAEKVVKRGDVLEIDSGEMVMVKRIGTRATIVRTKSEAELIIPNAQLVQNKIYNDTHTDSLHRLEANVGVSYSSDLEQVRTVLEQTCHDLKWRSTKHDPQILLAEFGRSSVNYRVLVWVDDPWSTGPLLSALNEGIWYALKNAGVVIAFPQLDVHFFRENAGANGQDS